MAAIASSNSRLHESPTRGNENVNKTDLATRRFTTNLALEGRERDGEDPMPCKALQTYCITPHWH